MTDGPPTMIDSDLLVTALEYQQELCRELATTMDRDDMRSQADGITRAIHEVRKLTRAHDA